MTINRDGSGARRRRAELPAKRQTVSLNFVASNQTAALKQFEAPWETV